VGDPSEYYEGGAADMEQFLLSGLSAIVAGVIVALIIRRIFRQ
jgi:hypothetical protein